MNWPEWMRVGPLRAGTFHSDLHQERIGAWLGLALGVAFGTCFLTGLLSHLIQQPPAWFHWPSRPAGLYRITQSLHVATGIAAIPLLLAKLWVVYPHFWTWPPLRSIAHAVERISLFPLISGSLFLLVSGLLNVANWYPWAFFFPRTHYWAAWITIGALVVHIAAKLPITRNALRRVREAPGPIRDGLTRRGFLTTVGAGVAAVTVATVGQTLRPLRGVSVLGARDPQVGPQGLPVNKSAASARVLQTARDPGYRLRVEGNVQRPLSLTIDDLRSLPQTEARLPISCVEGWSANASWRGVPVRDLLELAGAPEGASVRVESLQPRGLYRASELSPGHAADRHTLLATEVNGEELHIDHGYPVRLIGPNRPGVMQTKWVSRLIVR
ncbi:MAG TPA: molybdopterin-dependent oxidoreductase [Actinomycetota bacterium]|jgi:hypothetical protein|nr:molybdopterin-dependent oxidoreductase [Actinomycetota bacterium]